jgi:hypothetical protein
VPRIRPNGAISNMPIGGNPFSAAIELTRIVVDVPISVHTPPKSDENESGISSFEGLTLSSRAIAMTVGSRIATAAVLLMKAETTAVPIIIAASARKKLLEPTLARAAPIQVTAPALSRPALRTNIAPTVTVAGLENPRNASVGLMMPGASRADITNSATRSVRTLSVTNRTTAPRRTRTTYAAAGSISPRIAPQAARFHKSPPADLDTEAGLGLAQPMMTRRIVTGLLVAATCIAGAAAAQTDPPANPPYGGYLWRDADGDPLPFQDLDEIEKSLQKGRIKMTTRLGVGVTNPKKLLLRREDTMFHAVFKDVDVSEKNVRRKVAGEERNYRVWRDSYTYDIAAYDLDQLLGLERVPPSVRRSVEGRRGAATIWLEDTISEAERREMGIEPPDLGHWNQQLQIKYLYDNLVADRDANLGNTLIDASWRLWFIDCSRCFGTSDELLYADRITHCERGLLQQLTALDEKRAKSALGSQLSRYEVAALLKRRDKLVQIIEDRIEAFGEHHVLFDLLPSPGTAPWADD